jgi:hypothetical protein
MMRNEQHGVSLSGDNEQIGNRYNRVYKNIYIYFFSPAFVLCIEIEFTILDAFGMGIRCADHVTPSIH